MNRWGALALVVVALAAALALRLPHLAARPLHNDESVNATKLAALLDHGEYAYDPHEYHGPSLHYFSLLTVWLSGANDSAALNENNLRLTPVIFGVGMILLILLFYDDLGWGAIAFTAILTAVSPAMVFYSRYFIHETLLVFFTAFTLGAAWRYLRTGFDTWAMAAGAGLGLMWATKETGLLLALVAMFLATGLTLIFDGRRIARERAHRGVSFARELVPAAFGLAVVWVTLFSSFYSNSKGLVDSFRAFGSWFNLAGGQTTHLHPWSFYLERLAWFHPPGGQVWSEGLILALALIGAIVSLFGGKSPLHRFLALYTIALTAIYSAISYKTPWCLLGFFYGMILLAGVGAEALLAMCRWRTLRYSVALIVVALAVQLGWQAWRASVELASDRRNPYVYSQTLPDVLRLVERVEALAKIHPDGHAMMVKVISPESYWPLPWYLRGFKNAGWWDQLPDDPIAPVVIVSSKLGDAFDAKTGRRWQMAELYELRPGVYLALYVEAELWKNLVEPK